MFQGKFQGEGSFKDVLRVFHDFQGCFQSVSRKLSRCLKKVSCCMALIAASRAEGGLVFSLGHTPKSFGSVANADLVPNAHFERRLFSYKK